MTGAATAANATKSQARRDITGAGASATTVGRSGGASSGGFGRKGAVERPSGIRVSRGGDAAGPGCRASAVEAVVPGLLVDTQTRKASAKARQVGNRSAGSLAIAFRQILSSWGWRSARH